MPRPLSHSISYQSVLDYMSEVPEGCTISQIRDQCFPPDFKRQQKTVWEQLRYLLRKLEDQGKVRRDKHGRQVTYYLRLRSTDRGQ